MASRMNMLRSLFRRGVQSVKRPCTSFSLLLASACVDEKGANTPTQLKLLSHKEMTHEALIRQACTLTTNSSTQLLTQVLIAIDDTSQEYRKAISELMVLMEESLLLLTNSRISSLNDVEDKIVEQRNFVDEKRKLLLELISLMGYVEKMVTSTAETAYLAGAEHSSTLMCERLNSALNKVEEESAANKKSEEELLLLQETYVLKLGELYEREWKEGDKNEIEEIGVSEIRPIDIFEDAPVNDVGDAEANSSV
ncbi:uncharacterized protein LOC113217931 [Frankliniella occidentalis]|uniref:Direct IAP-binding protein with low pI n=1 Tax=Frankliniella occidentalis TaxID=133901 RepID=A0A6J1TT37_FRAOC|nr:uncharacterized protein LOC113217931 [Frankliniella occidentalis]